MRRLVSALALLALPLSALPAGAAANKSDNIRLIGSVRYTGGSELAALGDYVYTGEADANEDGRRGQEPEGGGLHIVDVSGKKPKEVGFLHCPGNDNDVEAVRKGLVAMSFHQNMCAPAAGNGFMLIDVANPKAPKIVGMINTGTNHTFKPYPGEPLIYTAGGDATGGPAAGPAIVDVSNPRKPKVVARPQTLTTDCHDISFSITGERALGFCAGALGTGEVQVWDVTDPLGPVTIGRIVNPLIQYSHYAVANSEGNLLAIDDEAYVAHDCNSGASPTGRVWIYDISTPQAPILQSSYAPPRGGDGTLNIGTLPGWVPSWCLAHGLDWQPKSNNLGVTWFTGGVSVLNLDNPLAPEEVAYFQAENSATYSVLWHRGMMFTNDSARGMDAFRIKGLK